jgi:two-component system chemotaxis response regulator CheY
VNLNLPILIVDDSPAVLSVVRLVLAKCGFTNIAEAENGSAAMKHLSKCYCELVISDLNMPEVDGLELLHLIRNDPKIRHISFVLMSAEKNAASVIAAKQLQADGFIYKPFTPQALMDKLHSISKLVPAEE